MPMSPESLEAIKNLEAALGPLGEAEETVLQTSASILQDKKIASPQRIQISNLFVNSSANIRNSITQIQQAIQQARTLP